MLYFQWSLYLPYASMQTVCQYEPPTIARCASFTMAAHRYPGCQQGFGSLAFAVDEDLKDHSDIQLLLINQKWDFCGSFGLPALKIRNFLKTKCPIHICLESKSEKIFLKKDNSLLAISGRVFKMNISKCVCKSNQKCFKISKAVLLASLPTTT